MTTFPKGTTVYTSNLKQGELIHMYFAFYNLTSIHVLTSILTVVSENTITIWVILLHPSDPLSALFTSF